MLIAPWFCSDRDGEMAHGEKFMIAMTAPNVPIADLRLNNSVDCGSHRARLGRSMIVSIGSCQLRINAATHRWFEDFNSTAIEVSMS
jgi:hypothetical protein